MHQSINPNPSRWGVGALGRAGVRQVVKHQSASSSGASLDVFRMYYTTLDAADTQADGKPRYVLGLATSEDGFKWNKLGRTFAGNSGGQTASGEPLFDAGGVSRRHVVRLFDDTTSGGGDGGGDGGGGGGGGGGAAEEVGSAEGGSAEGGSAVGEAAERPPTYTMIYEGIGAGGRGHSLGLATSADGVTWSASPEPILAPSGAAGDWDGKSVGSPHLVRLGGGRGRLRLYYVGTSLDGVSSIGCAEGHVDDLSSWTRVEA